MPPELWKIEPSGADAGMGAPTAAPSGGSQGDSATATAPDAAEASDSPPTDREVAEDSPATEASMLHLIPTVLMSACCGLLLL